MSTAHIGAAPGDFAEIVLMPGDPKRAKYIADRYLDDVKMVNEVRNMFGFTGTYRGKKLSVMAHGMGMPSCSIYVTELIKNFGVKKIFRVGSCGSVRKDVGIHDIVVGMGACTDSNINRTLFDGCDFAATADFDLLMQVVTTAKKQNKKIKVGNLFSTDFFYHTHPERFALFRQFGIVGVEMEAAAIYIIAAALGAQAITVCTVSDLIPVPQANFPIDTDIKKDHLAEDGRKSIVDLTAIEREQGFNQMIELVLAAATENS